jgi:hypothetical protein
MLWQASVSPFQLAAFLHKQCHISQPQTMGLLRSARHQEYIPLKTITQTPIGRFDPPVGEGGGNPV